MVIPKSTAPHSKKQIVLANNLVTVVV